MRRTPGLAVAFCAALAASAVSPGAVAAPATVSSYLVVLEPGSASPAAAAARLASRYGGQLGFVYGHALRGFSIRTSDRAAAALANNPNVAYVEPDAVMSVAAQDEPTGVRRVDAGANVGIDGVDDQRVDVDVAVIDTGIDLDHPDLAVAGGVSCLSGSCVSGGDDDHYHGTHVAGTVAALDNDLGVVGVAPGARLWAVKVLNKRGSGSNSGVIAGIDWVAGQGGIEIANLSLGGSYSQAVNDAVAGAVSSGVSVVVAAGNSADDAADYSPASEPTAITVSALADFGGAAGGGAAATCRTDVDDTFASFSNYGSPVDVIAPGVCIRSTYPLERGSYGTISGTSMAAPHVAGGVALLRSNPSTGREAAEVALKTAGSTAWNDVDDPDSTKEPLLNVASFAPTFVNAPTDGGGGGGGGGTDPGNPTFTGTSSRNGKSAWKATVSVSQAAPGAVIAGTWSTGGSGGCTAGSTGTCSFSLTKISSSVPSVSWTWSGGGTPVTVTRP
jgi:subtilisin family serine protease